ncbi:hypothetical protein [Auraticoccus monumenti]|uniref:Uncharacterized protein n=1 Tax=Auraticoccus monumenti TaxID=675864 RepID=A0A1G6U477_9ACTN|nr:hypothetical protein [Auraticoccus monumenti]SDD36081.1 hypothetical protein SAMN04489747_0789 [Auraticoccus monumenti]
MTTVTALVAETLRMAARTGQLWWRLWPQLVGVLLLGWAGYHLSLIISVDLSPRLPWLVIPTFAAGLVSLLAGVVVTLRMVASQLGVTSLVRAASGAEEDDDGDVSVLRLLTITLLPFLAVYAAFGYVEELSTDLVVLSSYTTGFTENVLARLNPVTSSTALVLTITAVVGLYVLRRVIDHLYQRSGLRGLGLLTAFVEACFLLVTVLSGFRLVEHAGLWLGDRRFAAWWTAALDDLAAGFSFFRLDLPAVLDRVGAFLTDVLWPVLWDSLSEPIAWLAMAALVFGSKVLSVAELWRKGEPLAARVPGAERMRLTRRLGQAAEGATGVRRAVLHVQEAFLGDIDDKYLPTLQSLRLVLRAGAVFLGAYVLAFAVMRLLGLGLGAVLSGLIGGQEGDTWVFLQPLVDLVDQVLMMSVQVTLLAVAFARALTIFADRTPEETGVETASLPRQLTRRLRPLGQLGVALALCTVLAVSTVLLQREDEADVTRAQVDQAGELVGRQVTTSAPGFGQQLVDVSGGSDPLPTTGVFVVVPVEFAAPGRSGLTVRAELVVGQRRYQPGLGTTSLSADAGFVTSGDFVFEIDPADVAAGMTVRYTLGELFSGYSGRLETDLGVDRARAEELHGDLVGQTVTYRTSTTTRGIGS